MNIYALLAGLFSGISGSMGLGGGMVLIIYLAFFTNNSQLKNQGINLLFFVPIALFSVAVYIKNKKISFKTVIPIALGGLLGAIGGILLADILSAKLLSKLFGGFLCVFGIKEIFTLKQKKSKKK